MTHEGSRYGLGMRADSASVVTGKTKDSWKLKLNRVICNIVFFFFLNSKVIQHIQTQWNVIILWHVATQTGNFELSHLAGGCLLILDQCMAWSSVCVPVSVLTWNEEKQTVSVCFLGLWALCLERTWSHKHTFLCSYLKLGINRF